MGSIFISLCVSLFSIFAVHCAHTTDKLHRNIRSNDGEEFQPDEYDSVAYCEAYCDVYGYYQPGKWCVSEDESVDVYCCGDDDTRYCCVDESKSVGDVTPVKSCPNSTWFYHQWKVIVGLLSTLVVMLLLATCCYYCCGGNRQGYGRARGRLFSSRARTAPDEENTTADPTFDPASPYAFQPPEYSLPKDPPKYDEIISGVDNAGFVSQEGGSPSIANPAPNSIEADVDRGLPEASTTGASPVQLEIEAPPVYSEVDNSNADTGAANESSVASVHTATIVSGNSNSNASRHVSVITHGSPINTGTVSDLPHVESCLPPPYEEIPSIVPSASSTNEQDHETGNSDNVSETRNADQRDENTNE